MVSTGGTAEEYDRFEHFITSFVILISTEVARHFAHTMALSLMNRAKAFIQRRGNTSTSSTNTFEGIPENLQKDFNDIINAVKHVEKSKDILSETCLRGMQLVKEISGNSALDQAKIGDLMIERTTFCKMFASCWAREGFLEMFVNGSEDQGSQGERSFNFYRALAGICWNYTDESDAFCQQLDDNDGIKLMVDWLLSLRNEGKLNKWVIEITFNVLNILHNSCRRIENIRRAHHRVVPFLEKLAESEDHIVQACAFLTLSYLVKKDEAHKLSVNDACVEKLLSLLKESLENLEHKIRIERQTGTDYFRRGFTLSSLELVQGVEQLAINDDNKRSIVEKGGIAILGRMLEMDCTLQEKTHAAEGLWQLAFLPVNKDKLLQEHDIVKELKQLSRSDEPSLQKACMGALFEIYDSKLPGEVSTEKESEPVTEEMTPSTVEKPSSRIMISYKWEEPAKDVMREIKDQLKGMGYRVWMDEEYMSGCMIDAMAKAVEDADVILACITQGYQESKNCRTEATYGYDKNKKIVPLKVKPFQPTGWLGAITAGKIYYLIPEVDAVSQELPRIVKLEIEKENDSEKESKPVKEPEAPSPTPVPTVEPADPEVSNWDVEKVRQWLIANNISSRNECLQQLNGVQLIQLKKQLQTAPESFYQSMKEDLKVGLMDKLSLAAALEKL